MIIGFDGSRAFVKDRTGTENYSYQLLKALAKIDKKNNYLVFLRPGVKAEKLPDNFKFKVISWKKFWTQAGLAINTFKDELDVLFVPSHTLPLIRKPGLKTVVTVHDLGSEYLPSMHQLKQRLYLSIMQKHQLKTASKIIAVSKATKQDLIKRLRIDEKKITVVYEGFDKSLFRPVKDDVLINSLRQYHLKPKSYFLFVGTVQPRKNLERMIKAFAVLLGVLPARDPNVHPRSATLAAATRSRRSSGPSRPFSLSPLGADTLNLVIAGSKGWLSDEIYALPKQLGIEDKVKFLGYVPDKDLPALYCGAKAFLFPSLFEGFGLPILEAQACGCPVITSNISSMPEIAGQAGSGGAILVDPYNIGDIVKGMEKLENRRWRMEYRKLGFENIKRFSWEKCAAQTLGVLEEVIKETKGG